MRKIAPLLLLLVVGGLALVMFLAPWQTWRLDYDVLGNKGLEVWLQKHDIAVRRSQKHDAITREELSLRIMPFPYFLDFAGMPKNMPRMDQSRFIEKVFEMPSLVILPKWDTQNIKNGVANRFSMLSLWVLNENMSKVIENLELKRDMWDDFTTQKVPLDMFFTPARRYEINLYQMQFFDPESIPDFCRSILSTSKGALLLFCDAKEKLYFLSDPDLLNNHGLALGEHATLAIDMITALRGFEDTRPIYLDNNADLFKSDGWEEEEEGRDYERDSDDLIRMFDYPLSVIWGMMCLVVMVSLWRGFYRFGPLKKDMETPVEISKTAAVGATARLLRLSRNDRRMVAQFVHGLLLKTAAQRFGRDSAHEAGVERLLKNFERRDRQKAAAARALIANLTDEQSPVGAGELRHKLHLLQQFIKEF